MNRIAVNFGTEVSVDTGFRFLASMSRSDPYHLNISARNQASVRVPLLLHSTDNTVSHTHIHTYIHIRIFIDVILLPF